ncbi:MAG: hypothetical protein ACREGI_04190, partial [Candidatus Levyibacteriota bacterium]
MKKILITITLILLTIRSISPVFADTTSAINTGISYLKTQKQPDGSISGFSGVSEWAGIAFEAAGIDIGTVSASGS